LPVILIVGVFTGLVLGLQGYYVLNRFEGVSLVANYRGQLDAQFRKGGAQVLSTHLNNPSRARNENIPSSSVRFGIGVSPHSEFMCES
jgi:hypothetical protein